jgi:beta-glucosidase-like glycosyl hydrolase
LLSDKRVISSIKHFIGDGGTEKGDDQGDNLSTEQALFDIHGEGYVGGLTAGAQTVMASFNSWHGKKSHGNKYLLTDVLKGRVVFDGFVVGDWSVTWQERVIATKTFQEQHQSGYQCQWTNYELEISTDPSFDYLELLQKKVAF